MPVLRRFARPLLASTFVAGGCAAWRDLASAEPAPVSAPKREPAPQHQTVMERIRRIPQDPRQLAMVTSSVKVGAGALLALGRLPRVSAAALAAAGLPSMLAQEPYWQVDDPEERAHRRARFYQDLALLGGLLLAAADTHGKPSLAYRTKHAVHEAVHDAGESVHQAVDGLTGGVRDLTGGARDAVDGALDHVPHLPGR